MRIGIFVVAASATVMGITIKTVYGLWFLCSDLVYVVLFPQLVTVVYFNGTNTYGSMCAYWIGLFLRLTGGEALFGLPALIEYPSYDKKEKLQRFPFRTMSMLASFFIIISVSRLAKFLFERDYLDKKWDIFHCVTNIPIESMALKESVTADELSRLNTMNNLSKIANSNHLDSAE